MSKHIQTVIDHYTPLVSEDAPGYWILDWSSQEAQFTRFRILAEEARARLGNRPFSLLDVGCGIADLADYLRQQRLPVQYTGVDITPAVLAEARRRHPALDLRNAGVFGDHCPLAPGAVDVTCCSAAFNLRQDNSLDFARHGLRRLALLASRFALANFLHVRTTEKYDQCCYFRPDELTDAVPDVAVTVRDDYLERDFSILLEHPQSPST